jgi:hypothetical protein
VALRCNNAVPRAETRPCDTTYCNEITKKEVSVIFDMSNLPENEQMQFFHEEFMPLAAAEHAVREQLREVGQRSSSPSTVQ